MGLRVWELKGLMVCWLKGLRAWWLKGLRALGLMKQYLNIGVALATPLSHSLTTYHFEFVGQEELQQQAHRQQR